jgi:signal transduction histidine kinase
MLVDFITAHQKTLAARTRATSAMLHHTLPAAESPEWMPLFIHHLTENLRDKADAPSSQRLGAAAAHRGSELLGRGYTVAEVVHDYGALCQAITELAAEKHANISAEEFRRLNRCLDDAIAEAVTEYVRLHDQTLAFGEVERSGVLAHELRNKLSAAQVGFDAIKSGRAPVVGAVAAVVTRSLDGIAMLISRTLLEVRLDSGLSHRTVVPLCELIDEAHEEAALEAARRGVMLSVDHVDPSIEINVDPQILHGVLGNLLQNALKFTPRGGLVRVAVTPTSGRIRIRVEDECGGLPPGKFEELFDAFAQRGPDRSGLGLGLFISRKGIEASGGSIFVRDVPRHGCIFTIELPIADRSSESPRDAASLVKPPAECAAGLAGGADRAVEHGAMPDGGESAAEGVNRTPATSRGGTRRGSGPPRS